MSERRAMEKHRISGIDCAQCASDIEIALRKVEGFEDATVSFATETVFIPAGGRDAAERIIARLEPGARIASEETGVFPENAEPRSAAERGNDRRDHAVGIPGVFRLV